jgi:hypothetical protein
MTAIELIIFLTMIALGVLLGRAMYPRGISLAIIGFVCGVALIPCITLAHERHRRWLYMGDEWMPDCVCGSSEFRYEKVDAEFHLLCQKCKRRYEKRGGDVWAFDGTAKQFHKRLVKHRGWV